MFNRALNEHTETVAEMTVCARAVLQAAELMTETLSQGGRVLFCGNGGSAADAQHLAAELSGRYLKDRKPLDGVALTCNSSAVTAVANDYGYEEAFARQVEAHGRRGDVLVAISTGGNSPNVVNAAKRAKDIGISVVAMTGSSECELAGFADVVIAVPSTNTPRIQEMHIFAGHTICEIVEDNLFPDA